jgi:acyl-coenzyme A synthetase/AMP-(fatty) acid ligase/thioesterase domain-containing protein/acyl carrier protein
MKGTISLQHESLGDALALLAASQPAAPVLHVPGRRSLTRGELGAQIRYVRECLGSWGIAPGDVVAGVLPNRPEMAIACATLPSSSTFAPLGPTLTADAYARLIVRMHATAVLVPRGRDHPIRAAAQLHGIAEIDVVSQPDAAAGLFTLDLCRAGKSLRAAKAARPELAYILVSAGTTGQPKLVPSTHRQTLLYAKAANEWLEYSPSDVGCHLTPIHLGAGLRSGLINPLLGGLPIIILPESDVDAFFCAIAEFQPTCLNAGFTLHRAILRRAPEYREALRQSHFLFLRAGNGRLHPQEIDRLEQAFGAPVLVAFSSVETPISHDPLPPRRRKRGAAGLPLVNEVAVMDDAGRISVTDITGEIVVRGPLVFPGYLDDPRLTATSFADDWFRTGDLGHIDDEGYVHISGRIKEIINRGGEKVSPMEIDAAMESLPGVREAATFGIPHPSLGEEIVAALVKHADAAIDEAQIIEHVRQRMGPVKVPRRIYFVDQIPRTGNGKVRRLELPRMLGLDQSSTAQGGCSGATADPVSLSPLEGALVGLWASLLKIGHIDRNDNFFLVGGDSLHAVELVVHVKTLFGVELPIQSVFTEAATVAGMARTIESIRNGNTATYGNASTLVALNTKGSLPPIFGVPGRLGNAVAFAQLSRELGDDQPFYALQAAGLDGTRAPLDTIEKMAKLYLSDIRTVQPHGPYALIGFCFGATVSCEMSHQLLAAGEEVAFLGLLDPPRRDGNKVSKSPAFASRPFRRAMALHSLVMSRLRLYLYEMRRIGFSDRIRFVANKVRASRGLIAEHDKLKGIQPELNQFEVYRTNVLARRRYQRKALKGCLTALEILETNRPDREPLDLRGFWEGGISRHLVPGKDPGDMLLGENVRVVAALLAKRLRIAREELERTRSDPADHNDPTQLQNRPILTNDGRLRGQDTSQGQ